MAVVTPRRVGRVGLAVLNVAAVVVVVRAVAGAWVAALVVAPVLLGLLVAGWAVVEARLFDRRPGAVVVRRPAEDHVAFARALTAVAAAYLAECEREAGR
jgi:hypothetical protein